MGTTTFGREGENLAKVYLEKKGYKFLDRNFKRIHGEVDLIMMDGDVIVFVEVKTRTTRSSESPIESISEQKLNHVRRAAEHYLYEKQIEDRYCRFDAIGVQIIAGQPHIEHLEDVLDY